MKRGSITVYLSLLLPVMIALVFASVFSVKVQADRTALGNAMDQGLYSLFAQYDRDMLAYYDLFFIDGSCGASGLHAEKLAERLKGAMTAVAEPERAPLNLGTRRLFDLSFGETSFTGMTLAGDMQGRVFEAAAIAAMRESTGLAAISRLLSLTDGAGQKEASGEAKEILDAWERDGALGLPESLPVEEADSQAAVDAGSELPEGQMADAFSDSERAAGSEILNTLRDLVHKPILASAVPAGMEVSEKAVGLSSYASKRGCTGGFGVIETAATDFGVTDVLLYKEYLMRHFGNALHPTAVGELAYQLEYLLSGQASDADNLASVLTKILLLREGVNLVYLLSDSTKMAEAKALAELLAALLFNPELAPGIEVLLLGAWAYGESAVDLHALLLGKRIAMAKTAESWQVGLKNLPALLTGSVDRLIKEAPAGLAYEDFLRIFLLLAGEEELNLRALDMVEATMRGQGRTNFCADTLIYALAIETEATAEGRVALTGERKLSYADL